MQLLVLTKFHVLICSLRTVSTFSITWTEKRLPHKCGRRDSPRRCAPTKIVILSETKWSRRICAPNCYLASGKCEDSSTRTAASEWQGVRRDPLSHLRWQLPQRGSQGTALQRPPLTRGLAFAKQKTGGVKVWKFRFLPRMREYLKYFLSLSHLRWQLPQRGSQGTAHHRKGCHPAQGSKKRGAFCNAPFLYFW